VDAEHFWEERAAELEEYARLSLRVGVDLEPGQDVTIHAYVEHAPLVRAIARVAYAEGARWVDTHYIDLYVRRANARPTRRSAGPRSGCSNGRRRRQSNTPHS
jgi:leucyl aminopeptidase (aminopeptidase T)